MTSQKLGFCDQKELDFCVLFRYYFIQMTSQRQYLLRIPFSSVLFVEIVLGRSLNDCQEGKIIPNFAYEVFKDKLSINHHPLYSPLRRFLFTLLDIYLSKYCLWLKLILDLFFVSI